MKTTKKLLALYLVLLSGKGVAQSTQNGVGVLGYFALGGVTTHYLGWDAATTIPLNVNHRGDQPINFLTNNVQRMLIRGQTGLYQGYVGIGLNFTGPTSLLHLNSTGYNTGEVFKTTSNASGTDLNAWRMFTALGAGAASERFRLYTQVNNNVFFQTTTANAIYGIRTGDNTRKGLRMLVLGQSDSTENTGRVAFGNNLPEGFSPQDRLHLHQDNDQDFVRIRFSNSITGVGNNDGSALGIVSGTGEFRLTQYEKQAITFFTNSNVTANAQRSRLRIAPNGQVFLGAYGNNLNENIIDSLAENGFTTDRTGLLNVRGPIYSCYPVTTANPVATILYGFTDPEKDNSPGVNDGFRMKMARNYFGAKHDALIFEKSDAFSTDNDTLNYPNSPDGGIVFTNTGVNDVEVPSFYIRGTGRTYVGKNVLVNTQMRNRFTIDSEYDSTATGDASKSGLRFIDLTKAETPITNPNPDGGVLGVDIDGNVIYVKAGGATGPIGLTGPTGPMGPAGPTGPTGADGIANANNGLSVNSLTGNVVLGNNPGGSAAQLIDNREIPMSGNTIDFRGEGTVHISQGANLLNTNASLDVNNQTSTNTIGINFSGIPTSNNSNQKGILATMNVLNTSPTNNSAVIEASNTQKYAHAAGWIIKANGFYGTSGAPDLADQASFGVLGNGNVMVNGNLTNLDHTKANFVVNDFTNSNNNGLGGKRSMYVSNTHPNGSPNYGLDVYAENTSESPIGTRTKASALNNSSNATGLYAESFTDNQTNAVGNNTAIIARSNSNGALPQNFGVHIKVEGSLTTNVGLYSSALGVSNSENAGIDAVASGSDVANYGVKGKTDYGGFKNYGVHGTAAGGSQANYSIYGDVSTGAVDNISNYAGYFKGFTYVDGNLQVNGVVNASNGSPLTSDGTLKTNINPLTNASNIINALNPKSFYFDTLNAYGFHFDKKKQYGFVAQDVELILPELISHNTKRAEYDSLGNVVTQAYEYKALNYNAFIGILTQGMKEQQAELDKKDSVINDLNTRLSRLESCLSALLPTLCEMNQSAVQQTPQEVQQQLQQKISVTLSNRNTLVLSQNVPNPFAEKTVIAYNVPTTVQKAQLIFYDGNGQLINSVDIPERGNGELTVFANDLSSGMYTYSLVADGKVVATKKMMKN